jgi:hypothetical protein
VLRNIIQLYVLINIACFIAAHAAVDMQIPVSSLAVPQSGRLITLTFEMPKAHSLGTILDKYKEDKAQLEEGQTQLMICQADVNAQRLIQEEAMEKKQASKSSGSKKKKGRHCSQHLCNVIIFVLSFIQQSTAVLRCRR